MSASFRLGRIRRLHEQVRRLRQAEAEALDAQLGRLRRRLEMTRAERERVATARNRPELAIESTRLGMVWAYEQYLESSASRLDGELARGSDLLRARRDAIRQSHQEERKLERLEEQHAQRRAERLRRCEDDLLDELSSQGFQRLKQAKA